MNSMSGFLDGIVNFVFRLLVDETGTAMDDAITIGDYEVVGEYVGAWVKNFFSTEVNTFK